MKKMLMILVCMCSIKTMAGSCDSKLLEMKAFAAAIDAEGIDLQGEQPDMEIEPMSSHNAYRVVFTYSGIRHVWRVGVDDMSCRVQLVTRF